MRRNGILFAILSGLALGLALALSLFLNSQPQAVSLAADAGSATATPDLESALETPRVSASRVPSETKPSTLPVLEVGAPRRADLADVLVLYDTRSESRFEESFCAVAAYYGLICDRQPLDLVPLESDSLRDALGRTYKLIAIEADTLFAYPALLTTAELRVLTNAIHLGHTSMFVTRMSPYVDYTELAALTGDAILGAGTPDSPGVSWAVSGSMPDLTREFSGQTIPVASGISPEHWALALGEDASVDTLISTVDEASEAYPVFVRLPLGGGDLFVDCAPPGPNLTAGPLRYFYNDPALFSSVLPAMMVIRYALGDEAWHSNLNYANLTIDDPALQEPWQELSYVALLETMDAQDFHTTIAMHPVTHDLSEPVVLRLFRQRPDRFSLVQHGNEGDGYEFYLYEASSSPASSGDYESEEQLPLRPLVDQEADILEGLARMAMHKSVTGVACDRIMVFPWGIAPEGSLTLLKRYNYLATVNAQSVPLDAPTPEAWDYGMYQADAEYGSFPLLTRTHPGTYHPFEPVVEPFIFNLFLDKPALVYSHADELFAEDIGAFGSFADGLNGLVGGVEWQSLAHIVRHLYLWKLNDDDSIDVKYYSRNVVVTNETYRERTFHLSKAETLNVPIAYLTVNGHRFPYTVEEGRLHVDVVVPARESVELNIEYGD